MEHTAVFDVIGDPKDKLINVDLDGTLCTGDYWGGKNEPKPNKEMIAKVQEWFDMGAHIIIWTGRQPRLYPDTLAWLIKHRVPFHGISMQTKLGADAYIIDDRVIRPEEIL